MDQIEQPKKARRGAELTTRGSIGQQVIHRSIMELRQQRRTLNTLMKSLGLPDSDEERAEPAVRRSMTGRAGAETRWGN